MALKDLDLGASDDEFDESATRDASGQLSGIEFSWTVAGNKQHKSWDNTVIAQIHIQGRELCFEVNSEARAERARAEVERRLGSRARYRATERTSNEELSEQSGQAHGPGEPQERGAAAALDLDDPALRAELERMLSAHWANWLDSPLPVSKGARPRARPRAARAGAGGTRPCSMTWPRARIPTTCSCPISSTCARSWASLAAGASRRARPDAPCTGRARPSAPQHALRGRCPAISAWSTRVLRTLEQQTLGAVDGTFRRRSEGGLHARDRPRIAAGARASGSSGLAFRQVGRGIWARQGSPGRMHGSRIRLDLSMDHV